MRYLASLLLLSASLQAQWSTTPTSVSRADWQPLTGQQRARLWVEDAVYSPGALFSAAAPAAFQHLAHEPEQWELGASGYGRRFASNLARSAMGDTFTSAGSAALGYEVRYVRSERTETGARLAHALAFSFLTLDRHGKTTLDVPRIGSTFGAAFIANQWMPAGYRSAGDVAATAAAQFGVRMMLNVAREFMPKRKKK